MTTNKLRLRLISHVLRLDRAGLEAVARICAEQLAPRIPADCPEWISIPTAAKILHCHPAHLRRLAHRQVPLLLDRQKHASGQTAWHLHRSALETLARAMPRHASAIQPHNRAHLPESAHLLPTIQADTENAPSPQQLPCESPLAQDVRRPKKGARTAPKPAVVQSTIPTPQKCPTPQ